MSAARRAWPLFASVLLLAGVWQVMSAGWIHAKAIVAQRLIAAAWDSASRGGVARRPWPWADMRPVARLSVPARGVKLYVLDNASPRALAFGPAHVGGTAWPGTWGNMVLVAHRDTHFAFLRTLEIDDAIELDGGRGQHASYRVREVRIVDQGESRVLDASDAGRLTLITCWPFDAIRPGTPLRFVVVAERVA